MRRDFRNKGMGRTIAMINLYDRIMKEENKYYTPEIEEFHVGFEVEMQKEETSEWEKGKVNLTTLRMLAIREELDLWHYLEHHIRVKYLDREDIESLGFEITTDKTFANNEFEIELLPNNVVEIERYYVNQEHLFKGTIKNKSELKRVIKMIGI